MVKPDFAHLHCHSIYSVQDAIPKPKDYVDAIYRYNSDPSSKYNCTGLAITDHGNIYALVKHYEACLNPDDKSRITKPIYGCEVYHCVDRSVEDMTQPHRYHLVLLAKNEIGLKNLYQIVSDGGINPYEGRTRNFPICDLVYMKGHGEGIIALTACIGGIVPKHILNGDEDGAKYYIQELKSIFDEVYLEVQPHSMPEQLIVNDALVRLSQETNTELVMTSDSHYIYETDNKYHDILKDMSHQKHFDNTAKLYEPEEMEAYCTIHNIPLSCITNTGVIANQCNVDPKPKDHRGLLPIFDCPPGYDDNTYLRKKCLEGIKIKYEKGSISLEEIPEILDSLFYELDVICGQGFASYFLILWDWFDWCRNNGILTGPGRGSAAGSIISYLLNITKLNPIRNGFVFARFMSPYRVEFPDEFKAA